MLGPTVAAFFGWEILGEMFRAFGIIWTNMQGFFSRKSMDPVNIRKLDLTYVNFNWELSTTCQWLKPVFFGFSTFRFLAPSSTEDQFDEPENEQPAAFSTGPVGAHTDEELSGLAIGDKMICKPRSKSQEI